MSLSGVLSTYPLPDGSGKRPYFTSGDLIAPRAVLFISGLTGGLMDVPYLIPLSEALRQAEWRLVQIHWSGAYDGYGTGSLDRDVAEMGALIKQLKDEAGLETIVIMGHSTGSQDVIHYLSSRSPSASPSRPIVQGGIMQAPASDREYFEQMEDDLAKKMKEQLPKAEGMIKEGRGDELMDRETCKAMGLMMTAYRFFSLYGKGGDDDYFSSDLPDTPDHTTPHTHPLSTSFGNLSAPALALWSEGDQYGKLPSAAETLARWEKAGKGKVKTYIVKGANHAVEQKEAQEDLCKMVVDWLASTVKRV